MQQRPTELAENIWGYLSEIAQTRAHPARVLTLATVDQQGMPQARSVILRTVEPWKLEIYTDTRSPKVGQLLAKSAAQLLLWDAQRQLQLRFSATAQVVTHGERLGSIWQAIKSTAAAQDYLAPQAPGELLDQEAEPLQSPSLAVLEFRVAEVDVLQLSRDGHTRQRRTPEGVQALVP